MTYKSHCKYDPEDETNILCSVGKITSWGGYIVAYIHDDVPADERQELAERIANLLNNAKSDPK